MTVVHPCDDVSAEELTAQLLDLNGPSYMRTTRNKVPRMYEDGDKLRIGKGSVLKEGNDLAIFSCGVMVVEAMAASDTLSAEGIECSVVDMHTIKPLDKSLISKLATRCGCFVSAEDHSVIGGLGSALSEWIAANNPIPLEMVGVKDMFGQSGSSSELMEIMGLTRTDICEAARKAVGRKNSL